MLNGLLVTFKVSMSSTGEMVMFFHHFYYLAKSSLIHISTQTTHPSTQQCTCLHVWSRVWMAMCMHCCIHSWRLCVLFFCTQRSIHAAVHACDHACSHPRTQQCTRSRRRTRPCILTLSHPRTRPYTKSVYCRVDG